MKVSKFALAAFACGAFAACDKAQQLPFDHASDPVSRTVPDAGATLSSPAGASVTLPAGAVAGGTQVTLTPGVAAATTSSGTAAGASEFRLDPAGLALSKPADVGLTINRTENAWLAAVVVQSPAGAVESGDAGVDLATGMLRGQIGTLGTIQATIPEAGAILRANALGTAIAHNRLPAPLAAAVASPTKTLRADCGGPGKRCAGLIMEVSPNLLGMVDSAAIVFPKLGGTLTINGATATGSLVMQAPVRVRLASRANAATIPVRITAEATPATVVTETAGRVTLANMKVTGESGSTHGVTTYTLTVDYSGTQAFIRLSHDFTTTVANGQQEAVTVAAQLPLVRTQ